MSIDRSKYMDAEEVRQLRTVTEAWAITDLQHGRRRGPLVWALVDTALGTGLRVSELGALVVGDVDLRRGALKVRRRKRRKALVETIPLGRELCDHLEAYIEHKGQAGQDTDKAARLFVGERGALSESGLQRLWKAAIKRAGLPVELSIHRARHTLAVHLLRKTGNLRMVQKQLGHASPTVTANLYADVSFEDQKDGVNDLYGPTGNGQGNGADLSEYGKAALDILRQLGWAAGKARKTIEAILKADPAAKTPAIVAAALKA